MESLGSTVRDVISLDPDRVALFGYAHVPWMKKHQTMINEDHLPDANMRFDLMNRAASMLKEAGYQAIGLDHFAKPEDALAVAAREGRLVRNFQGYTDDDATALIGLGASSIGRLPQGYVQNIPATGMYEKAANSSALAVARGIAFSEDDRLRGYVIERLMCDYRLSIDALKARFGAAAAQIVAEAQDLVDSDRDGHVTIRDGVLVVAPEAWPFIRSVAARFDAYLGNGRGRHSIAV
jgi:oxygen-independent coproporphyrinogen-3 oxidase